MKQTSFETRERAAELIRETASIWKQSNNAELLEGLQNDPVFNILTAALAHLANEMDADIAHTVDNVWNEFAQEMMPYAAGRPRPATMAVSMMPVGSAGEVVVDSDQSFVLNAEKDFRFLPLLRTKVLGADVASISRLDGRRWSVRFALSREIGNLKGFAFAIDSCVYGDLVVSLGDRPLSVIRPCDYADMPYTAPFSLNTMLYNNSPVFNSSVATMDLFARQNIRLYYIDDSEPLQDGAHEFELVFEFVGINRDFVFDRSMLKLNVNILVNAHKETAMLSGRMPFARVGGDSHLMHVIHPDSDQILGDRDVRVFRTGGDRFNSATLLNLLRCIENHFNSDYWAFERANDGTLDRTISSISALTHSLASTIDMDTSEHVQGTYIKLRQESVADDQEFSIDYLVTEASGVNPYLTDEMDISAPVGIDTKTLHTVGTPVSACDEATDGNDRIWMAKYYMATGDRIVTPADIKIFCRTELAVRYGIVEEMIEEVTVRPHAESRVPSRYVIEVNVVLKDNRFVKRNFADRIPMVESLLSSMIAVRSSNIYPIEVKIRVR